MIDTSLTLGLVLAAAGVVPALLALTQDRGRSNLRQDGSLANLATITAKGAIERARRAGAGTILGVRWARCGWQVLAADEDGQRREFRVDAWTGRLA